MSSTGNVRALVVFESMFGNTAAVARAVAEGLRIEGVDASLVGVRDHPPADVSSYEVLVVGAPTHAFSLSRPATRGDAVRQGAPAAAAETGLREWLTELARDPHHGRVRLAAAFDTRVRRVRRLPAAAAPRALRMLTQAGFEPLARPTGFVVEDVKGELLSGELDRALAWGRRLATDGTDRVLASSIWAT